MLHDAIEQERSRLSHASAQNDVFRVQHVLDVDARDRKMGAGILPDPKRKRVAGFCGLGDVLRGDRLAVGDLGCKDAPFAIGDRS